MSSAEHLLQRTIQNYAIYALFLKVIKVKIVDLPSQEPSNNSVEQKAPKRNSYNFDCITFSSKSKILDQKHDVRHLVKEPKRPISNGLVQIFRVSQTRSKCTSIRMVSSFKRLIQEIKTILSNWKDAKKLEKEEANPMKEKVYEN